jgi:hypothetical protein
LAECVLLRVGTSEDGETNDLQAIACQQGHKVQMLLLLLLLLLPRSLVNRETYLNEQNTNERKG